MSILKSLNLRSGMAMAACLLFGASAMAQTMSFGDFSARKTRIKKKYKADKKACASLSSYAKDICVAQAKANFGKR
jgi:hypothetical protein